MGFVFYDTETTGTDTHFDQILQFAAIKTDYELNELERFEIRCRLLPHVVPSPGATLITGIGPSQFTHSELPSHYEMVCAIKAKLDEWTPAIFLGHNTLSFDEHLLRQAFYKTLHVPYLTNTNRNCRADSLPMIQCLHLYALGIVNVPLGDNQKPNFKLDQLAPANGFNHNAAHDAMGDAEAALYLCRLLADRADDYWSNFVRFTQKSAVLEFARDEEFFCFTVTSFGKVYPYVVCRIGENPDYETAQFVFNLAIDPEELALLDDIALAARLEQRPKPVRILRANAFPLLLAFEDIPSPIRAAMPEKCVLKTRAARIKDDGHFTQRLINAFLSTQPERALSPHVEKQIYDSFASDVDQTLMNRFHTMDWIDRPKLLESLSDSRARILGERLLHAEAPEALPSSVRENHDIAIAQRLMGTNGSTPWLTLPKALADTRNMLTVASGSDATLLLELQDYLIDRSEKASTLLA
ncbi:MAG: exonuclease domain-containing protein [Candidatus Poribacteria bacterium]|nr:exonuclease domain-containing protein [Candidatus Poribacteria bacterium]